MLEDRVREFREFKEVKKFDPDEPLPKERIGGRGRPPSNQPDQVIRPPDPAPPTVANPDTNIVKSDKVRYGQSIRQGRR
jgi:hypothetical protein